MKPSEIKLKIRKSLFDNLSIIDSVLSVTLVGSFIDNKDLSGISDIDTIVVCKYLDKKLFNDCIDAVKKIDLQKCGLVGHTLKINPTFGPLKFDRPNLAVVHLMIYDLKSHRKHVLASPFTCFDWERSDVYRGLNLKNIFPVGLLQPRDFIEVRRSLVNYMNDLNDRVISYREYDFNDNYISEIKKAKTLDNRHQGEYTYHIVSNLVANYLKLCRKNNKKYYNIEIKEEIIRLFPKSGKAFVNVFETIYQIKSKRVESFPKKTSKWTEKFLTKFQKSFDKEWSDAIKVNFIRHFKTKLNDGTYLGQRRDPGIDNTGGIEKIFKPVSKLYSSPLRRCIQSANKIYNNMEIISDNRLKEFDYGKADGLSYDQLLIQYPEIAIGWENGEDPKFPDGENTQDVHARLKYFLDDLAKSIENEHSYGISIITHNGVLRCLLGDAFGLDMNEWYKLLIPHGISLEFLFWRNRFYPNISRPIWFEIFHNIGYKRS